MGLWGGLRAPPSAERLGGRRTGILPAPHRHIAGVWGLRAGGGLCRTTGPLAPLSTGSTVRDRCRAPRPATRRRPYQRGWGRVERVRRFSRSAPIVLLWPRWRMHPIIDTSPMSPETAAYIRLCDALRRSPKPRYATDEDWQLILQAYIAWRDASDRRDLKLWRAQRTALREGQLPSYLAAPRGLTLLEVERHARAHRARTEREELREWRSTNRW